MLIDTHAHLTMREFGDLDSVVERAKNAKISSIINVGFDAGSSAKCVELADKYDLMYACLGVHPHHAESVNEESIDNLRVLAKNKKVVAVGETGLDYYQNNCPKDAQKRAFLQHIMLAKELDLPLSIHSRDAGSELIEIVKGQKCGIGVFHCFSEGKEYAQKVLDLNFYISFTGAITFKNAASVREVVSYVPLEKMMIETDCPYLAPQQRRGQRNEPSYIRFIAERIAEIKNVSFEKVADVTSSNARALFKGIP